MEIGNPEKLIQPREHKAKVCIWGDLTVADVDALCEVDKPDERKSILSSLFGLYHGDSMESANMKDEIILDLYYYTIQFCIDNNFSKEQISAFFSIIKRTHAICTETPFGNVHQTFRYFKDMLLCHAVKRPPFSIELFSPDQVRILTEYTINTYFRHFKMYKYTFTPQVKLDLGITYEGIPVPSPPPEEEVEPETGDIELEVPQDEPEQAPTPEPQLTEAQMELRALIQRQLEEEVGKLRATMDEQLRVSDDSLQKKLAIAEGSSNRGSSKGGRKKK